MKPLPDRLVTELTAHRTLALRAALGERPEIAFLAALHALCLRVFYRYNLDSCIELDIKHVAFSAQGPELADSVSAHTLDERHQAWVSALPKESEELWDALVAMGEEKTRMLFAYCVSVGVNAVIEPYNRRPRAIAHADRLAQAVGLDMVAAGWTPTADNFLGRVTKARIVAAVEEAKGIEAARRIEGFKKPDMVKEAEQLLAGTGWLPESLRAPAPVAEAVAQSAADGGEPAIDTAEMQAEDTVGTDDALPVAAE